jgi:hypothetical protein
MGARRDWSPVGRGGNTTPTAIPKLVRCSRADVDRSPNKNVLIPTWGRTYTLGLRWYVSERSSAALILVDRENTNSLLRTVEEVTAI